MGSISTCCASGWSGKAHALRCNPNAGHGSAESLPNDVDTVPQFLPVAVAPEPVTNQAEIEASAAIPKASGTIQIRLGDARIEIKGIVEHEAPQRVMDCPRQHDHAATPS